MEKLLNGTARFLAVVCAILFVPAAGLALLLFNAEKRLFNAESYTRALESQNFYESLPALIAETLAAAPAASEPASSRSYLNMLPTESREAVIRAFLPAEVSQPMTEQAIVSVFDYLNGRGETASLSLAGFKNYLTSPAGLEAALDILRSQPPCTLEQIAQLTVGSLFGQQTQFFLCNPSDELLDLFQPIIQAQIQAAAFALPDSVDLTPNAASAGHPLAGLRAVRTVMRFSPLLPLGFLFLVTILAVRDLKDWQRWWGIPILASGIFGIALAASIAPLSNWAFLAYAAPRIPAALPASVREMIQGLVMEALSGVARPILVQSIALGLIGSLALLATRLKKPGAEPS